MLDSPVSDADAPTAWETGLAALRLFCVAPHALGGVRVRARPGSAREEWLVMLSALLPKETVVRRIPAAIPPGRLLGGLDLSATLALGKPVAERGVLEETTGGVLVLAMAERVEPATAATLSQALDRGRVRVERDGLSAEVAAAVGIVALDEGIEAEEQVPEVLAERLAFTIDLDPVQLGDLIADPGSRPEIEAARARLDAVELPDDMLEVLAGVSLGLGIRSERPALLAATAARAAAALAGRQAVTQEDATLAAALVLAPRATQRPEQDQSDSEPPPPPPEPETDQDNTDTPPPDPGEVDLSDVILAAAQAAIPDQLLARLKAADAGQRGQGATGKAGAVRAAKRRGRPAGVMRGDLASGRRLNVIETLRAAAPWQPLRRGSQGIDRVIVTKDDFRFTRLKHRSETTTIFVVDASGSAALHRLAEVKGAIELLLADCYVRRDEVSLIAFRKTEAEMILPPTRSLVRAKRQLSGLPGGGGTPLAAGLDAAFLLAEGQRKKGKTPVIVVMTDGKANVTREGTGGRVQAGAEATDAARQFRAEGHTALLIDIGPRPTSAANSLAAEMGATYLPLPNARAGDLSDVVGAATQGRV